MRYLVLLKAVTTPDGPPPPELMQAIMQLGEDARNAGVLLDTQGLQPSAAGARVSLLGGAMSTADGPFTESKELIAGFWLWQVRSMEEAVEWLKRCPNPNNEETEVEIRPIYEMADFEAQFTPELRKQEERLRKQVSAKKR